MSRVMRTATESAMNYTRRDGVWHFTWTNTGQSAAVYDRLRDLFWHNTDYGPLTATGRDAIAKAVARFNVEAGAVGNAAITPESAIAIRNVVLKDKITRGYPRMNAKMPQIAQAYNKGRDVLQLSTKYDFPPLNMLRGIFLARGMDRQAVYAVFALRKPADTLLHGRDLEQYNLASANDAESTFNQQRIAAVAAENEARAVKYFVQKLGMRAKTQDDLTAEQTKKYGRAVITPDLLFIDEVYINDARVHWIDYKDYIGTSAKFVLQLNTEQAAKYTKKWGPGALLYRRGWIEGVKIPGAILLDVRPLQIPGLE